MNILENTFQYKPIPSQGGCKGGCKGDAMAFPAGAKSRVPGNFIPLFAEKRLDFRPNPAKIHGKSGIQFQICHEFALLIHFMLFSHELALHLLRFFP